MDGCGALLLQKILAPRFRNVEVYVSQLISLAGAEQEKATESNSDCDSCGLCHSTVEQIWIVSHIIEILGVKKAFLENSELTYNFREDKVGRTAKLRFAEIFHRVVFRGWKEDRLVISLDEPSETE